MAHGWSFAFDDAAGVEAQRHGGPAERGRDRPTMGTPFRWATSRVGGISEATAAVVIRVRVPLGHQSVYITATGVRTTHYSNALMENFFSILKTEVPPLSRSLLIMV
ncbi:hypothetical protein GCM10010123_38690 [Pilimelia anulata]|uniref:Transposase n=1 Tax=Pilimelia anulata TaxID=53371 RepID=A0A8J3BFE4_9ACTN|nr:hypothetical protein GCM10010123_38690 [Pilimelia anulata]